MNRSIVFILTVLLSTSLLKAIILNEDFKLTASDADLYDYFGKSISESGDYLIVGAHGADNYTGSAYIFHQENGSWIQQQKLTASDGANSDSFGSSVSIYGDYAIVGAPGDDKERGSVYIFYQENGVWILEQKLTASVREEDDYFGCSVSFSGDYAIVSAYGADTYTGSVYIFHQENGSWIQQQKLTASDGEAGDYFGRSVTASGNYLIVGADGADTYTGSAYIFHQENGSWIQQQKLTASDGEAGDHFGYSVSFSESGDYLIVGASGNNSSKGSAYVYFHSSGTWSELSKLTASDGEAGDHFGYSASISGNYAVVGAKGDNHNKGGAYVYFHSSGTWSELGTLTASTGIGYDLFGYSISTSGDIALIGAIGNNSFKGTVYGYLLNKAPVLSSTLTASEISQNSAMSGGIITYDNGLPIIEKGLCWNTTGLPTDADSKSSEVTIGKFTGKLSNLEPNTTYYVRAYAKNEYNIGYGEQITFTTSDISIAINNSQKISDTQYSFTSEIHNPDSIEIVDRGIVWSSEEEPTVFDHIGKVRSGDGSEIFTADATGLFANSSFYLRSYITTYQGTYYSASVHFGVVPVLPAWGLILLASGFIAASGWLLFRNYM